MIGFSVTLLPVPPAQNAERFPGANLKHVRRIGFSPKDFDTLLQDHRGPPCS